MLRAFWIVGLLLGLAGDPLRAAAPRPPLYPEPLPGAVVLAGPGSVPPAARARFLGLAGGRESGRVVVLGDGLDGVEEEVRALSRLEVPDRHAAEDAGLLSPLETATGVWVTGSEAGAFPGSYLETQLRGVLERGGVVGGSGAGAAVLGERLQDERGRAARGYGLLPGLMVVPAGGPVFPVPGFTGVCLPAGSAVLGGRRSLQAVDGTVTLSWAPAAGKTARTETLPPGSTADLFQVRRAAAFRALPRPFPPRRSVAPVVPRGSLVIIGGGGTTPEIMDRFFQLAGGKDALIVVVPTANDDGPIPADPGEARFLRRYGATNLRVLHTRDRLLANSPQFSRVLLEAKGVWFGGGRQWRFIDAYEGTLTEQRFREVLDRGGVIGGSSAGASIQSEYMPRGHPLGNTVMAAEGYERGFGYLPGCAVDQHFFARKRLADMTGLMKQYPQLLGIGIDEATAIVVQGHTAEVLGKSKVAFYDYRSGAPPGEKDYTELSAGGRYNLKERKPVP